MFDQSLEAFIKYLKFVSMKALHMSVKRRSLCETLRLNCTCAPSRTSSLASTRASTRARARPRAHLAFALVQVALRTSSCTTCSVLQVVKCRQYSGTIPCTFTRLVYLHVYVPVLYVYLYLYLHVSLCLHYELNVHIVVAFDLRIHELSLFLHTLQNPCSYPTHMLTVTGVTSRLPYSHFNALLGALSRAFCSKFAYGCSLTNTSTKN